MNIYRACCAGFVVLALTAGNVRAEPRSWDGGSLGGFSQGSWQDSANWNPDGVPTSTTDVTLGADVTPNHLVITADASLTANSLLISTVKTITVVDPTVFNLATFTLTSGDVTRQDVAGVEGDHTLIPVRLAADGLWDVAGSGKLIVSISESGGPRTFTKTGSGTLSANLNVTGVKTFNAGIFEGSINGTGAATFSTGAAYHLPGSTTTTSPVILTGNNDSLLAIVLQKVGTGAATMSGPVTLASTLGMSVASGGKLTLSGGITDNGSNKGFLHTGGGELVVSGPGTFSGNVVVIGGQLTVGHNSALGSAQVFVTNSGSFLAFSDAVTFSNPITVRGAGLRGVGDSTVASNITLEPISFSGPLNNILDVPNSLFTLTVNGNISEASAGFSVTKTGGGTLILGGSNSFTGGLTVAQGVLGSTTDAALSASVPTVIQAGARLDLQGNQTLNRPLQISGTGLGGLGAVRSASGDNTWAGTISLASNVSVGAASASALTVSGPISGAFGVTKVGDGTLRLTNAANVYTSLTIVDGALSLSSHTGIPAAIPINVSAGGAVSLLGSTAVDRTVNLNGGGASASVGALDNEAGDSTWAGPVNLQSASTVSARTGTLTVAGNISGAFPLTKIGSGLLALAGNNSHGDTSIQQGALTAQSNGALPAAGTVTVGPSTALQIGNGVMTSATASLRLNGQGTGLGALSIAQGSGEFAGPVTLVTDTAIGAAVGTALTLAGQVSDDVVHLPLVKVGPGTLVLAEANTYRGGTNVSAGILSISSNANLGDAAGAVTLNNGAKLLVTADTTTDRTFNLNTGSVQVDGGATLTYDGATVSGGFLRGPGTHDITGESNFSGVTALAGSNIIQSALATLNNFTNSGSLTSNAALAWDGGYNTGAGHVIVNSTLNTSAFENNGVVTINNGATLSNGGNDLVSSGGSRITVNSGGTLQLNTTSLDLHGALAVNNGAINGTTNVYFGSLAKGTGSYGAVNVFDGGTFSPGASPGEVSVAAASFNAGGHYLFEIRDAAGLPGFGLDFMDIAGGLTIAAGTTSNSPFVIGLASLDASHQRGLAANFNSSEPYSFVLATAAGGITGFSADVFRVDTSDFENNLAGGSFSVAQSGNGLLLNFNPAILPGDYNVDRNVDAADYIVWRKNAGTQSGYDTWRANFGRTAGSGSNAKAAVPEPATLVLLFVGMLMTSSCRLAAVSSTHASMTRAENGPFEPTRSTSHGQNNSTTDICC